MAFATQSPLQDRSTHPHTFQESVAQDYASSSGATWIQWLVNTQALRSGFLPQLGKLKAQTAPECSVGLAEALL